MNNTGWAELPATYPVLLINKTQAVTVKRFILHCTQALIEPEYITFVALQHLTGARIRYWLPLTGVLF